MVMGSATVATQSPFLLADGTKPISNKSANCKLKISGYPFDRMKALFDGRVKVEGCDVQMEAAKIGDMNTDVFSGAQTRDVTEIGLHPFMLAYANEGFRDYTLLPIFPLRVFRHKSIFIRTDREINKPEDLKGKSIATPGYSSTSLTWIRGMLQDEYGISPQDIKWVTAAQDSSAGTVGKVSKQESVVPEGLDITTGPAGKDESDLLESGEVDALFHAAEPRGFVQGHPKITRLFPDSKTVEQAYYKKTGIFPIMHAVAIKKSLVKKHPWLTEAIFNAYSQAKKLDYEHMNKLGWAFSSLPWYSQEVKATQDLMGDNFFSYGISSNRKALEALFRYSYEQGLSKRQLTIEELFAKESLSLVES